jgi:hypothetical protein
VARINGLEPEHVAEKCAVRFGVLAVNNYMSARNHLLLQRNTQAITQQTNDGTKSQLEEWSGDLKWYAVSGYLCSGD